MYKLCNADFLTLNHN